MAEEKRARRKRKKMRMPRKLKLKLRLRTWMRMMLMVGMTMMIARIERKKSDNNRFHDDLDLLENGMKKMKTRRKKH